ncbi:macro domain-containing protein [Photobacterium leiognathi]|uniref:macro domain-containing protein n=1 Tax=Photobacterium leiognathi TaxID=553611 RepID=UPI0029822C62|nr:macro domain-containing protein [Photobacterium leiognathi]
MKLNTLKGCLVEHAKQGHFDLILHGQNCKHGWKKGIAKKIALHFPEAKKADLMTKHGDKKKLGTYSQANIIIQDKPLTVINCYTQFNYGQGKHFNETAFRKCLRLINDEFAGKTVGYPKIGAGLAGGDWLTISAIIDEELTNIDHQLVVL